MTDSTDAVVIVSGGMDSITLLHYLVKKRNLRPAVITFSYGQKHVKEIDCARQNVSDLGGLEHLILDLSPMLPVFIKSALINEATPIPNLKEVVGDPQPPTYVPNRNMIFLALAVAYAETQGVTEVYYGAQRHDAYGYWDTTPDFLERLNQVYLLNRKTSIKIQAPLVEYSKTDILRLGLEIGVDYGKTWSCYAGKSRACGNCPSCGERLTAFANLGKTDPLWYE